MWRSARSDFGVLGPGQQLQFSYRFDPKCWSLAPGEPLLAIASFAHLPTMSPPAPSDTTSLLDKVSPAEWKKIVVPPGWKDLFPPRP